MAQSASIMTPEAAHLQAEQGRLLLIDIRRPSEWAETGIAEHAVAMTMHGPQAVPGLLDAIETYVEGNKDQAIALICRSGNRSAKVAAALASKGFHSVFDISVGMEGHLFKPGWIRRGLPITPYQNDADLP